MSSKLKADLRREPPRKTPVGEPWNHHEIVVNFDGILRSCGVSSLTVRRRMTIGMITAIGWRQNGWEYNFNGLKTGKSWSGPWYTRNAIEEDKDGDVYIIEGDTWRAYDSWSDSVAGWFKVVDQPWRTARALLEDDTVSDGDWWAQMGVDGWYTAKTDPVAWGNSIGRRVKKELAAATPQELEQAAMIDVGATPGPFAQKTLAVAVVVCAVALLAYWALKR